jgi:hypothetical protein
MKLKTTIFIVLPLIFFGCGAYFHLQKPKDSLEKSKLPENKSELQDQIEKFNGRKR